MVAIEDIIWVIEDDLIVGTYSVPGDRSLRLGADLSEMTESQAKIMIAAFFDAELASHEFGFLGFRDGII